MEAFKAWDGDKNGVITKVPQKKNPGFSVGGFFCWEGQWKQTKNIQKVQTKSPLTDKKTPMCLNMLTPTKHHINHQSYQSKPQQDELEAVLTSLACSTKPADLDAMLKEADLDADGKINYEVCDFLGGKWKDVL